MTGTEMEMPASLRRAAPVDIKGAKRAVAEIKTVEDAKSASDKLGAIVQYMENAGYPAEQCNEAAELKLTAERAGGQFLAKIERKKAGPGRGKKKGSQRWEGFVAECKRIGLANQDGYRWEKIGRTPEAQWNALLARHREQVKTKGRFGIITTNAALREAKEAEREKLRAESTGGARCRYASSKKSSLRITRAGSEPS